MKSLLIVILALALCAAAFFTRPSAESFNGYFDSVRKGSDSGNFFDKLLKEREKENELKSLVFKDKWLWVAMTKDGKTQYVGAFSHWFDRTEVTKAPVPAAPSK